MSFNEPLQQRQRRRHSTTSEVRVHSVVDEFNSKSKETDVDLPRRASVPRLVHQKAFRELSIDAAEEDVVVPALSQISPVLDPSIYEQLAFCDCALFPECVLGKGIPLELDRERRERMRTTDLLDELPAAEVQPAPVAARHLHPRRTRENPSARRRIAAKTRWSPPPPPVVDSPMLRRSPSPSISSFDGSSTSSYSEGEGEEKAILFRLPLTIAKAKDGRTGADCEVRERRKDGRRRGERVDFTEMGLFVAPPSETDPEESFVVVERRK